MVQELSYLFNPIKVSRFIVHEGWYLFGSVTLVSMLVSVRVSMLCLCVENHSVWKTKHKHQRTRTWLTLIHFCT